LINLLFPLLANGISANSSDEEIVAEYLSTQNVAYFDVLYRRYSTKIFGKCISLLKNEMQAQDAMQDIFMKILLNLSKFSGKSKFSTWIYSITYNFCIDLIRKKKKDKSILVDDISRVHDTPDDDIEDRFLLETSVNRLKVVLEKIPIDDKSVLMMKYQDDMSIREIGEVLDKSESAIKMKIKRAKQKFKLIHSELYSAENW
jgi:RNA polymerase sigma-70 factor (ECF subfamily)